MSDSVSSFNEVYNGLTDYLRIPLNTKDEQGNCMAVLSIQVNSIAMEVRLSPEKLCRARLDAAAALDAATLSFEQTESLTILLSAAWYKSVWLKPNLNKDSMHFCRHASIPLAGKEITLSVTFGMPG